MRAGLSQAVIPFDSLQSAREFSALELSCDGSNFGAETNASLALIQIELQALYRDRLRILVAATLLIGFDTLLEVLLVRHIPTGKCVRMKVRK